MAIPRITVLVSGRGSNLAALIDAERRGRLGGTIAAVLCNRAGAPALEIAAALGIATQAIEHRSYVDRGGERAWRIGEIVARTAGDEPTVVG